MKLAPVLPTLVPSKSTEAIETSSYNAFPASGLTLNPSAGQPFPASPTSAHSVRIRPGTPQIHHAANIGVAGARSFPMNSRKSSFVGTVHDPDSFAPPLGRVEEFWLKWNKLSSFVISSTFLILVVLYASCVRVLTGTPKIFKTTKPHVYPWDENARHWKKEKVVKDIGYYARQCGYDIIDETVETQDGYFLR